MMAGQPTQPTLGTHPGPPKGRENSYSATELQPPLVLPRRGDAGYSGLWVSC